MRARRASAAMVRSPGRGVLLVWLSALARSRAARQASWNAWSIAARMRAFPGYAQIHQVSVTFDEWTIDNGLLTPTLKVKRPKAMERYAAEIEQMYAGH